MKRKIIKLGTATLVASLPAKWIKEFNLKQGDYLEVEERKGDLVMSAEKGKSAEIEKKIDLRLLNTKLADQFIEAAYCMGYDRIELLHHSEILDHKTKNKIKTAKFIQDTLNKFIGVEVIEQSSERTILKDLGGISDQEADNILRRIFLLTKWMVSECVELVEKNDKGGLGAMDEREKNALKFLDYYRRLLNKKGYKDFSKTTVMYHNTFLLGDIVQSTRYIAQKYAEAKKKPDEKVLSMLKTLNSSVEKMDSLFFEFSHEKALSLIDDRTKILNNIKSARQKCTLEESKIYSEMSEIIINVSRLITGRFYLEL